VRDYLAPFRALGTAPRTSTVPKVRQITSWLLRRPIDLDVDEQTKLDQVLAACIHLDNAANHVRAFAEMLTGRHGKRLDDWMATVEAADLLDYAAVLNGLTLTHSSGAVEGNVNRIKMLKRQMYAAPNSTYSANASSTRPDSRSSSPITASGPEPGLRLRHDFSDRQWSLLGEQDPFAEQRR